MDKETFSGGEIIADEITKAKTFADLGMYKYFTEGEFPNLAESDPEAFALLLLLALKTRYSDISDVATLVVDDEDEHRALIAIRDEVEEIARKVVESLGVVPESSEHLPVFFVEQEERAEIDWYIEHGMPDLINVKNVTSLARIGKDNIEILRLMAKRKRIEIQEELKVKNHVGLNGSGAK